jgi:hypothetical protein
MARTEQVELTCLCLISRGDELLLQNRIKKDWRGYTLPGGHIEPGESFVDGVVREMKEEMFIEEAASQMICDSFLFAVSGRRATEEQSIPEKEKQASGHSTKETPVTRNSPSGKVYTGHKSQSGNGPQRTKKNQQEGVCLQVLPLRKTGLQKNRQKTIPRKR